MDLELSLKGFTTFRDVARGRCSSDDEQQQTVPATALASHIRRGHRKATCSLRGCAGRRAVRECDVLINPTNFVPTVRAILELF